MDKFKEYLRKKMVWIKHNPQVFPLLLIVISCVVFTFNLSLHSNACMYVVPGSIAFNIFIITLSSMLAIFSFLNVSGKKGKAKIVFLIVVHVLIGLQVFLSIVNLDILYNQRIEVNDDNVTSVLVKSASWVIAHVVFLVLSDLAILTQPLYHKLLLKVNTAPKSQEQYKQATKLDVLVEDEDDFSAKSTINQKIEQGDNKTENQNADENTD